MATLTSPPAWVREKDVGVSTHAFIQQRNQTERNVKSYTPKKKKKKEGVGEKGGGILGIEAVFASQRYCLSTPRKYEGENRRKRRTCVYDSVAMRFIDFRAWDDHLGRVQEKHERVGASSQARPQHRPHCEKNMRLV